MKKKFSKRVKKTLIIIGSVIIIVAGGLIFAKKALQNLNRNDIQEISYEVQEVGRRTIKNYLSSSGTLSALDTYSVTTLSGIEGTVLMADFEEGDTVTEGDVLYQISTDNMDSRLSSAQKSIDRAKKNYQSAQNDYSEAEKDYSKLNIYAKYAGYIKEINIEEGDDIQANSTKLMRIYNNRSMELRVPFLSSDISQIAKNQTAWVQISENGEWIEGTVTEIEELDEVLSGSRIVRYITITVDNPGAIVEGTKASGWIMEIDSCEEGEFKPVCDEFAVASMGGEISEIKVLEGQWVEEGELIAVLSEDTLKDKMEQLQDKIDSAKETLEDAQDSYDTVLENLSDYTITSPITGTVIRKYTKAGDTISSSSMGSSTMCLIYDLSAMTFDMYVDELDILSVEVGQEVILTADAFEDQEFTGVITTVSLVSTTSGGVTQYPVTVRLDEYGELLPGMNVSGEIVIESVEDVIAVPVDALQRGNFVYVEDESVTESEGAVPAGFRAVEVKTGISDGDYIEITEGLEEGSRVYVPKRRTSNSNMMMQGMPSDMSGMPSNMGNGMPSGGGDFGGNRGGGSPGGGTPGGMGGGMR